MKENIKVEFDANNNWIGFFVKANEEVWLKFSLDNEWKGFLV